VPLFYAAIGAFLAGVALCSLTGAPFAAYGMPLLLAAGFALAYVFQSHSLYKAAAICLCTFALGGVRCALAPHALPAAFEPLIGTKPTLDGVVAVDPDVRLTSVRASVRVMKDGERTNILAVLPAGTKIAYGDTVRITGTLKKPASFSSDGGRVFRYDHYLQKDGVFVLMQPARATILAPPHGGALILGSLYSLKDIFARGLERALPEPEAGLAQGLVTGGKQGLAKDLLEAFTIAGIVQIVVLSGYNVMIVAEAIMQGFSWLPKRMAISSAALGLIAFVAAAGAGSSAVRAALMACLALYAKASGRTYDVLRALTLTVACMVLWNPFTLTFDPSFQLSVLATYGLILGVPIVGPKLGWIHSAFLRDAVVTTISAELAVLPLLLWQTGNLSLVSVPANVSVSFIVPAAMAASAIAGAAGVCFPAIARLVGLPAYALLWIIVTAAEKIAALPFAQIQLPAFPWAVAVLAYAIELWLVMPARAGSAPRTRPS
jgi:competence protein ComEC